MNFKKIVTIFFALLFLNVAPNLTAQTVAQNTKKTASRNNSAETLKAFYFKRDYEAGYEVGRKLVGKTPENTELQAWFILNMSRSGMSKEAVEAAKTLLEKYPGDAWANFALGQAYLRNNQLNESIAPLDKALEIAPDNEEFIFGRAGYLLAQKKYPEIYALLDQNAAKLDKARMLTAKAEALYRDSTNVIIKAAASGQSFTVNAGTFTSDASTKIVRRETTTAPPASVKTDALNAASPIDAKKKQSLELFAEAARIAPNDVGANYLQGFFLNQERKFDEARIPLKKAVALAPEVALIHQEYWKAVFGSAQTDEQKNAEFAADAEKLIAARKNSPAALASVAQKYESLKNEAKRDFYEDQIIKIAPNTKYDEAIVFSRMTRDNKDYFKNFDPDGILTLRGKTEQTDIEKKKIADYDERREAYENELRKRRESYIARPAHFDEGKLGNVYLQLFRRIAADKNATDEQLKTIIEGTLAHRDSFSNINTNIAQFLNDNRKLRPDSVLNPEIEKYARAGIVEAETKAKTLPAFQADAGKADIAQSLKTLGEVLTSESKFDEAEANLLKAEQMSAGKTDNIMLEFANSAAVGSLANLSAARKDYAKAEEYLLRNANDNSYTKNKFADLYERQFGKKDGFEAYYAVIRPKIKEKMRERVFASRDRNGKPVAAFSLKTIDDKTISSADLKGKIIVINAWGTWCAPCVAEMPELQQLYKKYENDKDVAIITMDTSDELAAVKKFITDKKYDFPVLIGDSYMGNIMSGGNFVFPTTLFVDKEGKIAFVKKGNTGSVYEEFGWRIEALKEN